MIFIPFYQTSAPPVSAPTPVFDKVKSEKFEVIDGTSMTLEGFKGKVLVVTLFGRGSGEASGKIVSEIALAMAKRTDFAFVSVADLGGAPGFLRGAIRKSVRDSVKKGEERTKKRFEEKGVEYSAGKVPIYLLDWKGSIAKELSVEGKTERTYQLVLIGRKGEELFRFSQPAKPPKDFDPLPKILEAMKKAVETPETKSK